MVFCRDRCQSVGLIAETVEISLGNACKHAGKTGGDIPLFFAVAGVQQDIAHFWARCCRHLLDPDHKRKPPSAGGQKGSRAVEGSRARRAGILITRNGFEAKLRQELQHKRGGKVLTREAVVEQAYEGGIDILRCNLGIGNGCAGNWADQRFYVRFFQLAEFGVSPAYNAEIRHGVSLLAAGETPGFGKSVEGEEKMVKCEGA